MLPRFRYLWWAEFQKRGALHYHMVLVDPPFSDIAAARHWFDAHWTDAQGQRLAGIQTWVEYRSAAWFRSSAGNYVLKDVRKLHGKRYEQDYTRMPRGWRTFRSHQLTRTAAEHQAHETRAHAQCFEAHAHGRKACFKEIYVYRIDRHVAEPGGCRMHSQKSRARAARKPATQTGTNNLVYARETNPQPVGKIQAQAAAQLPQGSLDHNRPVVWQDPLSRLCRTQVRRSLNSAAAVSHDRADALTERSRAMAPSDGSH